MSIGLSAFVRKFLLNELTVRQEIDRPVLVWEKRSRQRKVDDEFAHLTEILTDFEGALQGKPVEELSHSPEVDEPLVFMLAKDGGEDLAREVTLGRTPQNDVVLPDSSVSRVHASFQQDATSREWNLIDRNSSNGTWVGPTRLSPNERARLPDRSRVRFGSVELLYLSPAAFLEYLRDVAPTTDDEAGVVEDLPQPPSGPRAPPPATPERRRFEFSLSLRDVDALLDFYRQSMKVFEAYGATVGRGDAVLEKAHERATTANEILRRLLVAARLHDL